MSFTINTNIASLQAQSYLNQSSAFQNTTINRVTSGLRIVNSGDDAAGLAIANGLRSDQAVLTQGIRNANDGLSTLQTVDGGMNNISQLLDRAPTLAPQSASGTVTLGTTAGLRFSSGDGTADPTVSFSGTLAQVNTALAGLGNGLVIAPNQDFVLSDVPQAQAGTAGGALITAQRLGAAIGIAVIGTALFGSGDREAGIDQLLTLFKRDREWNEQAARKQLLKFFEVMGPTDPLTLSGRRRLSSAMFS